MARQFPLADHSIIGFVATSDPERARKFYGEKLALPLIEEQMHIRPRLRRAWHDAARHHRQKRSRPPATPCSWKVPEIVTAAKGLTAAGVKFERYPGMEQDELGIWTSPRGGKVAWFKDPDGNTLGISQHE